MREIDLSTKESYLQWVTEWKEEYARISTEIRGAKDRKRFHRNAAREGKTDLDHTADMLTAYWRRLRLRPQARYLLEMRTDGKRLSWERRCEIVRQESVEIAAGVTE